MRDLIITADEAALAMARETRQCSHLNFGQRQVHIALGILPDGAKEVLSVWVEQTKGA